MRITEEVPINVRVLRAATDGALTVQVVTQPEAGRLRIELNYEPIWDGDPEGRQALDQVLLEAVMLILRDTGYIDEGDRADDLAALLTGGRFTPAR